MGWFLLLQPALKSAEQAKAEAENARLRLEAAEAGKRAVPEAKAPAEVKRPSAERAEAVKRRPVPVAKPQAPVESRITAAPPAAVPQVQRPTEPVPAAVPPRSYQGSWQAALSCRPFGRRPAFAADIPVSVTGGSFTLQRGEQGGPESLRLTGAPDANGRLQLAGDGFTGPPNRRQKSGQPYKAEFDGKFEGPRYKGTGQLGAQECALAITRAP